MQTLPELLEKAHRIHSNGRGALISSPSVVQAIRRIEKELLDREASSQLAEVNL